MKALQVINNNVINVFEDAVGNTSNLTYSEGSLAGVKGALYFVPDETAVAVGDAVSSVPGILGAAKTAKLADIAASRYEAETAGITVNGATIATDRTSQSMITGAALKAVQDATYTCKWKTPQGFVTLTAPQIIAIADAVRDHVQDCFDQEATLQVQIAAAETLEAVEAIVWG